nr:MAG TPA: hypothetical protein [Caudoviricetes sp.]
MILKGEISWQSIRLQASQGRVRYSSENVRKPKRT